jgi:hypothetical protein
MVALFEIGGQVAIRHQMEHGNFHGQKPPGRPLMAATTIPLLTILGRGAQ